MHLEVKKSNLGILSQTPKQNSPPGSYRHPHTKGNYSPPRLRFFTKIYSHSKKRGCYNLVITFRKKKFNQEEI